MNLPMPLTPRNQTRARPGYFGFDGGLNLVDPHNQLLPGVLIDSLNYEINQDPGYGRLEGYERRDGRPKPSGAAYSVLYFDAGTTEPAVDDVITGVTSSATGTLLATAVISSGSWAGNDAVGYLAIGAVSGTFQDNESLTIATADGTSISSGAPTGALHNTYLGLAVENRREDIAVVPGDGDVLGVWLYNGDAYAFRDDSGVGKMYKESSSGWTVQDLGESIEFTAGATEFLENETLTGGTSAATAIIKRVIVRSGSWSGNDAAGHLTLYTVSGTFQAETGTSASGSATLSGDATANTLGAAGAYQFFNYNFRGHASTNRMYGCNGVGNGFEWDGSVFTKIVTGMTTDAPVKVIGHKKHLFFSFTGGSLQHSSIGDPLIWNAITGASELTTGDEITGLAREVGNVLAVATRNDLYLLYGSSSADWDLRSFEQGAGAIDNTVQKMGIVWLFDDRGITTIATTQAYGDFAQATVSDKVQPWLTTKRTLVTASMRVRKKSQYRIFFSDKTAIYGTLRKNQVAGFTTVKFADDVTCACSGEDSTGAEELLIGSSDGFVYQLDSGNSFDDEVMPHYYRTVFHHYGSPGHNKKFRRLELEMKAPTLITLSVTPEFNFGASEVPSANPVSFSAVSGGGYWSQDNWVQFYWSAPVVGTGRAKLGGADAANMSLFVSGSSQYESAHQVHGATVLFSKRRLLR